MSRTTLISGPQHYDYLELKPCTSMRAQRLWPETFGGVMVGHQKTQSTSAGLKLDKLTDYLTTQPIGT